MIQPPTFETERLVLQPLSLRHSDGMFLLWSREEVCRHSGPAQDWDGNSLPMPVQSAADSDKIIKFFQHMAAEDRGFRWALVTRDSHEFAGAIGFNSLSPSPELAFHLRPEFWGRGLMREAAEAALRWLRDAHSEVEAYIEPENIASVGLARRLGFAATGARREGADQFILRR